MILATEAVGLTITVGQFLSAIAVFVAATAAVIGTIVRILLKFAELQADHAILEQRLKAAEGTQSHMAGKLDEIGATLNRISESVAVFAERLKADHAH